jgi:hypothetical protein
VAELDQSAPSCWVLAGLGLGPPSRLGALGVLLPVGPRAQEEMEPLTSIPPAELAEGLVAEEDSTAETGGHSWASLAPLDPPPQTLGGLEAPMSEIPLQEEGEERVLSALEATEGLETTGLLRAQGYLPPPIRGLEEAGVASPTLPLLHPMGSWATAGSAAAVERS